MRHFKFWNILLLCAGISLAGCAAQKKVLPLHDEVLKFNLPFDLTYLRTMEGLEHAEGWELQLTEKEKGVIVIRNISYGSIGDADQRDATFLLKRIGSHETSIQLAPDSQRVIGGGDLLKRISASLDRQANQ